MPIFRIGDPVVVVTDRALRGRLPSVHYPWDRIKFLPQNLQGKKGWIESEPWDDGEPAHYQVVFRLHDHPRTVLILELHQFGPKQSWRVIRRRQVESGWGYVRVRTDGLVHDTEPVGTYEQLQDEQYEAGVIHPNASRVFVMAEDLLMFRQAALRPEVYPAWFRENYHDLLSVEEMHDLYETFKAEWRLFQEEGWCSVHEYIKDYIGGNGALRLDWRPLVRVVEQAEHEDRTVFESLDPDGPLPTLDPVIGVSEPLRVRWK